MTQVFQKGKPSIGLLLCHTFFQQAKSKRRLWDYFLKGNENGKILTIKLQNRISELVAGCENEDTCRKETGKD